MGTAPCAKAGANTFRKRQSSLPVGSPSFASSVAPIELASCTHAEPNFVLSRAPVQRSAGSGARQRSGPTGGFANGIPSHACPP